LISIFTLFCNFSHCQTNDFKNHLIVALLAISISSVITTQEIDDQASYFTTNIPVKQLISALLTRSIRVSLPPKKEMTRK
jgi:hypothetical protein